jgi:radical SAM protein with 4Fe4S-binding SPASM domain
MQMNTNRVQLYEQLPLATPFSLHVFPSFYCNFKCSYCLHALSKEELEKKHFQKQYMGFDVFQKAVDDAKQFPDKIKALIFAGHGEPLLHRDIARMVAYAKQSGKFERIEIVTNGSLLTHERSDALIDAGLDRLRVSLQGVTKESYQEVSKVDIDFSAYIENLRYFYEHKTQTEVYIKIIDVALKDESQESIFHQIFDEIADITATEYAIPFVNEIDYSKVGELSHKCKQGNSQSSRICSMPFYMMVLNPDGSIVPCCSTQVPMIFGNVKEESLTDIWESRIRTLCLNRQLHGVERIPICRECSVPAFGLQPGDYLDGHEEELLEVYQK